MSGLNYFCCNCSCSLREINFKEILCAFHKYHKYRGAVIVSLFIFCIVMYYNYNPYHSGPVGIAAAAAIATGRKKGHPHQFETNPSRRKRQQTRLLRYYMSH